MINNLMILVIVGMIQLLITQYLIKYIQKNKTYEKEKLDIILEEWNRITNLMKRYYIIIPIAIILFSGAGFLINGYLVRKIIKKNV